MSLTENLTDIVESLNELELLSPTLGAPASVQKQYIGTCVDDTLVMLTGVANSIDGGGRHITFSDEASWHSAMKAVNRSFSNSIVSHTEKACADWCAAKGITVESRRLKKGQKLCELVRNASITDESIVQRLEKGILDLAGSKPAFSDYVNTVIENSNVGSERAKMWRKFFKALSTPRNKASHSDVTLSQHEVDELRASGFGALISSEGELQLNSRHYKEICGHVLLFFEELAK